MQALIFLYIYIVCIKNRCILRVPAFTEKTENDRIAHA